MQGEAAPANGERPIWLRPISAWTKVSVRSIASLGLNVQGAGVNPTLLLPAEVRKYRYSGRNYPLPDSPEELAILDALPIMNVASKEAGTQEQRYLSRVRRRLAQNGKITKPPRSRRVMILDREVREISKCRDLAAAEVEKVRDVVRKARSTLLETAHEFDEAFGMIARAFNTNQPLPNGENITVRELIAAYKSFYTHMDRLGGPITDDMQEEAEEVVFQRAIEAARDRVARTVLTAIESSGTIVECPDAQNPQ